MDARLRRTLFAQEFFLLRCQKLIKQLISMIALLTLKNRKKKRLEFSFGNRQE